MAEQAQTNNSALPPYKGSLQENLITALCHLNEGREVADLVDPALFEGDYRLIAERAVDYWKRYGKPPGPHTSDLISDILEDRHDRRAPTFRAILVEMLRLSESINASYVVESLEDFIRTQRFQAAVLDSARRLQSRRELALPEVEEMWADLLRSRGVGKLIAKPASAFKPRKTRWLWEPFLLRGAINLITGEGGVGKTLIAVDTAAWLSCWKKPKSTIYLTIEDEPHDLRPRLVAGGGDPELLLFIGEEDGQGGFDLVDSLTGKLDQIEKIIVDRGDVGMIVVDPFVDFSGRTDHYSETDVRKALKPLRALAQRYDLAVVIIVHFNKKQDLSVSGRTAGSMAFRNVPRSVLIVVPDREEPGRVLMIQDKFNKISRADDNAIGFTTRTRNGSPAIEWEGEMFQVDADETLKKPRGRPSKQGDAVDLLREALADGPVPQTQLAAIVEGRGISFATARKVKDEVPAESFKGDGGKWYWHLNPDAPPDEEAR